MSKFEYTGRYRGDIVSTGLTEAQNSQSIGFAMKVRWNEFYYQPDAANPDPAWGPIDDLEEFVTVWLVGKTGNLNEHGVKQLQAAMEWNGDWQTLRNTDWSGVKIQAEVKQESYEGKTQFKPSWVYHAEANVGSNISTIDDDRFNALLRQYGSQTRAICGARSAPPPNGRPASPPAPGNASARRRPPAPQTVPAGDGEMPTANDNDVPW